MGEIFRREAAEHPGPFTGERLTAAVGGQVEIEHYHRYLFARSMVAGLDVLDVASGEGYGSALLAQVARSVTGVEHSAPTTCIAAANFPRPNLRFLPGDARALPLADAAFDAVVSFETIEHFDRQAEFVREVRRVLRPDGIFIVSTPEREIYSPLSSQANPYHVFELNRLEFAGLLRQHFAHIRLLQQRALIGSALLEEAGSPTPPLVFDRRGDTHFEACIGLPRAPYMVAVASNRELNPLAPSLYINSSDLDAPANRITTLEREYRETREELEDKAVKLEQARLSLAHAEQLIERKEAERIAAEHCREQVQTQYDLVRSSARTFLRGYLPMLCQHLLRQRP
jgi:SAM-dependent methyltransferase